MRRDVRDRTVEITAEHVEAAKETLILERRTHIDSLVAWLREDRVRRVIAPMLAGGPVKLRRGTETEQEALDQVVRYLEHAGLDEGGW